MSDMLLLQLLVLMVVGVVAAIVVACGVSASVFILGEI